MCEHAFMECEALKNVIFQKGSRLEKLEFECFGCCGLEELTLPETLKDMDV